MATPSHHKEDLLEILGRGAGADPAARDLLLRAAALICDVNGCTLVLSESDWSAGLGQMGLIRDGSNTVTRETCCSWRTAVDREH